MDPGPCGRRSYWQAPWGALTIEDRGLGFRVFGVFRFFRVFRVLRVFRVFWVFRVFRVFGFRAR